MGGGSLGAAAAISARRFTHEHVMTGWGQVVQSALQHKQRHRRLDRFGAQQIG